MVAYRSVLEFVVVVGHENRQR